MSTTTSKKKKLLKTVTVNLGCSSCTRPKLSSIFSPKPKHPKYHQTHFNHHYYHHHPPSSSSTTTAADSDYYYYNYQTTPTTTNATTNTNLSTTSTNTTSSSPFMAVGGGWTEAVEKDSSDPYLDFRASMLQMIVENEMYTKDDLRHLLTCFLQLNSPCLHGVIIKAFTEIWNTFLFSDASANTNASHISAQVHEKSYNGRRGGGRKVGGRPPKAYVRAKSYGI